MRKSMIIGVIVTIIIIIMVVLLLTKINLITDEKINNSSISTGESINDCNLLSIGQEKYDCFTNIAKDTKNSSVCDYISTDKQAWPRAICIIEVAKKLQDISVCDSYISDCYTEVAVASNSLSICDYLNESWNKDKCYEKIAVVRRDIKICNNIPGECIESTNPSYRCSCYDAVASTTGNLSVCGFILHKDWENQCFRDVAVKILDDSVCDEITNEYFKVTCNYPIAIKLKDISICDKILSVSYGGGREYYSKEKCLSEIGKNP